MVSHVESAEGVAELSEYVGRSINVGTGSNDTAGNIPRISPQSPNMIMIFFKFKG